MSILELKARSSAGIKKLDYTYNDHTSPTFEIAPEKVSSNDDRMLLINWVLPTGPELYQVVNEWSIKFWQRSKYGDPVIYPRALYSEFDATKVTWETRPRIGDIYSRDWASKPSGNEGYWITTFDGPGAYAQRIAKNGLALTTGTYQVGISIDTVVGPHPPVLSITLGARKNAQIAQTTPGAGARLNKGQSNIFSFSIAEIGDGKILGIIAPETAKFTWRVAGTSTENEMQMGTSQSVEVPANTFPSAELQYKFTVRTNSGQDLVSDWITVYTTDTKSTAVALSPDGGIVDADNPVKFTWQHNNASGAPQTQAEIALNHDNEGFVNNLLPKSANMFHTFSAGKLKGGSYEWKVRTYNLDGQPGEWSTPKQFLALAKIAAPVITSLTNAPRPVMTWQSDGQSAYQIKVDDEPPGTYYGQADKWKSPDYLSPGSHNVSIRIQDAFGYWSDWASAEATIPPPFFNLNLIKIDCGNSVRLSWAQKFVHVIIYRNGIPIGISDGDSFVDNYSVGPVSYFARGESSDAKRYGLSPTYNIECLPETVVFQPGPDEEWLSLGVSDQQYRVITTSFEQQTSSLYLSGRDYPVQMERPFKRKSIDVDFASADPEFIAKIKNSVGKLVCIKTPGGDMVRGHLSQLSVGEGVFYTVFSIHLDEEYIEERVNLDAD